MKCAMRSFLAEIKTPARNPRGVDQGAHFVYFTLSYRRRLIRDLFAVPPSLIALGIASIWTAPILGPVVWFMIPSWIVFASCFGGYNYHMWKTLEGSDPVTN